MNGFKDLIIKPDTLKTKKLFLVIAFFVVAGTLYDQIQLWISAENATYGLFSQKTTAYTANKIKTYSAGYITNDLLIIASFPTKKIENKNRPLVISAQETEQIFKGSATYYSDKLQGNKTANGELYDKVKYTAAIRYNAIPLPFGTMVEVTNSKTNKKVVVKINDRMSSKAKSKIDLSRAAFEQIGNINDGKLDVTIRVVNNSEK